MSRFLLTLKVIKMQYHMIIKLVLTGGAPSQNSIIPLPIKFPWQPKEPVITLTINEKWVRTSKVPIQLSMGVYYIAYRIEACERVS